MRRIIWLGPPEKWPGQIEAFASIRDRSSVFAASRVLLSHAWH
jgi:hypothetical protein